MSLCAACGLPGHRYGRNEGMERYDPVACINQLRGELERRSVDYGAARRTFDELYYGNPTELGLVLDKTIAAALGLETAEGQGET